MTWLSSAWSPNYTDRFVGQIFGSSLVNCCIFVIQAKNKHRRSVHKHPGKNKRRGWNRPCTDTHIYRLDLHGHLQPQLVGPGAGEAVWAGSPMFQVVLLIAFGFVMNSARSGAR